MATKKKAVKVEKKNEHPRRWVELTYFQEHKDIAGGPDQGRWLLNPEDVVEIVEGVQRGYRLVWTGRNSRLGRSVTKVRESYDQLIKLLGIKPERCE